MLLWSSISTILFLKLEFLCFIWYGLGPPEDVCSDRIWLEYCSLRYVELLAFWEELLPTRWSWTCWLFICYSFCFESLLIFLCELAITEFKLGIVEVFWAGKVPSLSQGVSSMASIRPGLSGSAYLFVRLVPWSYLDACPDCRGKYSPFFCLPVLEKTLLFLEDSFPFFTFVLCILIGG